MREHYLCVVEIIKNIEELERATNKKTDMAIVNQLKKDFLLDNKLAPSSDLFFEFKNCMNQV